MYFISAAEMFIANNRTSCILDFISPLLSVDCIYLEMSNWILPQKNWSKTIWEAGNLTFYAWKITWYQNCCVVWGNCSNEGLNRILKLQKRTARLILDQDPIAPSEPLFKQQGWMSIEQRIKYRIYLLVSKCLKKEAPVHLKNKIQYLSDRNLYSLRNVVSEKLQIPKAKTELFKKTFTYSGIKLWNEFPFSIRQASSHNAFKTKVKRVSF